MHQIALNTFDICIPPQDIWGNVQLQDHLGKTCENPYPLGKEIH